MAERSFAAYDIDGTIVRWQLYHAIGDALATSGAIDPDAFERVKKARMEWKRRTGNEGFGAYERCLIDVFDTALVSMPVKTFEEAAITVFEEYKDQVYTYTRNQIRSLGKAGLLQFAVSGSPSIIVEMFANYYQFDDFAATTYEVIDGKFTGVKDLSVGKKPQLLQALIDKHDATAKGSYAFGDSEGDIGMLAMVENPVAFNPSQGLYDHARYHEWQIVLERKNVVYELGARDGSYVLATPNKG